MMTVERESTEDRAAQGSSVRGSARVACERCRNRKIKCDNGRPRCGRCEKNDLECTYLGGGPSWSMVSELEHRIRELEQDKASGVGTSPLHPQAPTRSHLPPHRQSIGDMTQGPPRQPETPVPGSSRARDDSWTAQIPIHSGQMDDFPQLPSNSQLLDQLPPSVGIPSPLFERQSSAQGVLPPEASLLPPINIAWQLMKHFLTCTNVPFPVLHAPTLERTVEAVCGVPPRASADDYLVICYMLALAAVSLPKHSSNRTWPHPSQIDRSSGASMVGHRDLYDAACAYHDTRHRPTGLHSLQILIIKTQYALYEPSAGNVWDLAGAAVRKAIDLGLHHATQGRSQNHDPLMIDMRRRLFWSAYSMDRVLSFGLGRPPAIEDSWISTQLPALVDDTLIDQSGIRDGPPSPAKQAATFHFTIRRLQSEVYTVLYNPTSAQGRLAPEDAWYESVTARLNRLRSSILPVGTFVSKGWMELNYHHTMVLLHRPSPVVAAPPRDSLKKALCGAIGMMNMYKDMYRSGRVNYNWVAMYQLFTAGVTYLISLWQAHSNGWKLVDDLASAMMALQNCMSIMEALAALTPGTSAILNAFENVSQRIIRHLTSANGAFSVPGSPSRMVDAPLPTLCADPTIALHDFLDFMGTNAQQFTEGGGGNIPDPNLVFDDMWQQMLNPDFQWDPSL